MLDRGTKIYAGVLAIVVLAGLFAVLYQPTKVRELNRLLATDAQLAAYPYAFRVLCIEGDTAVMGSPRSAEVPVQQMIGAIDPSLAHSSGDDPKFLRAQQQLADYQSRARALALADAEIESVRWELDVDWLRAQGIQTTP
jgi:hypothetical protein